MGSPIVLEFKKAIGSSQLIGLDTFTSYSFDRNIMVPASAFRFAAPGVDKSSRMQIRSADNIYLFAVDNSGALQPLATGIIDETDTHITKADVTYNLMGRDVIGQLVDNSAIDSKNVMEQLQNVNLNTILTKLISNTRIPQGFISQQVPNANKILFQTNAGETKMSSLKRYLDLTNCLVWSKPNGQLVLGKPNFTQTVSGSLISRYSDPTYNNAFEVRVKRNTNTAIRQIAVQLQDLERVNTGYITKVNNDKDMQQFQKTKVGRSVYELFSYGSGTEVVNQINNLGNQGATPRGAGDEYALRKIAEDNVKILDVECVVAGHINENNIPYNIDQMYQVIIEDEDVTEDMYVYAVTYELTPETGAITRLRLCRKNTLVAYAAALSKVG